MRVAATVAADDHGVSVLQPVGGVPMLVRAVRCVLDAGVSSPVWIDVPVDDVAVMHACAGLPVRVHSSSPPPGLDDTIGVADTVRLVHDARRPLTPSSLVAAVIEAVEAGWAAAVPALPLTDTVKLVDADGLVNGSPDRGGLRVIQSPRAWRADTATAHLVPGDPLAFPVHTEWDLELAGLLA